MGSRASTLAFTSLTAGELLHAISCRSEKYSLFSEDKLPPNKYLNMALLGTFALQGLCMAVPWLRGILGITPINMLDGLVVGSSALLPLVVNEGTKQTPQGASGRSRLDDQSYLRRGKWKG
jgi:Ca2+-transporting ATPase